MESLSGKTEGRDFLQKLVRINDPDEDFEIDADVVAKGLKIDVVRLQTGLRNGSITSLCERGVGEDEGRFRLTFFSENCQYRLLVDEDGNVIQSSVINFGDRITPEMPRTADIPQRKRHV